jgi:hypothetical protein
MAIAALTGERLTMEDAEELTGFVLDSPTWQFAELLAFADRGVSVLDAEHFAPEEFVDDAAAAIARQVGDDKAAEWIVSVTDLELEGARVAQCLANPMVTFEDRRPTLIDLQTQLASGAVVICNVNSRVLVGKDGYMPHGVVLLAISDDEVLLHDPGIPPKPNLPVPLEVFERAWHFPSPDMANMIVARVPAAEDTLSEQGR